MKRCILLSFILVGLVPAVLLAIFLPTAEPKANNLPSVSSNEMQSVEDDFEILPQEEKSVRLLQDGQVSIFPLETYIVSVVLGEMPTEFEMEALKAQAVVARTYTCRSFEKSKHSNADVCTDSSCCQAFLSCDDYISAGGTQDELDKVNQAVESTKGEVLTYDGELIEATYFSCSGGRTEDAAAVWGTAVPYLQSVLSPGEEKATHFMDTVKFTANEFCSLLGDEISGYPGTWVKNIQYTEGGGVASLTIGDITYSGTQLRKKLGLRSTAFVITAAGNTISVTTRGFGHRVGMSQYGAEAMAVQGSDYRQILFHYYLGTQIENLSG